MPRTLPSQAPTYPLDKITHATNREEETVFSWVVEPKRDNLYLVFNKKKVKIDNDKYVERTMLNVTCANRVMEHVDLDQLVIDFRHAEQNCQPCPLSAMFQPPNLAIRYKMATGLIRRFQIRFVLESDCLLAVSTLQQAGIHVQDKNTRPLTSATQGSLLRPSLPHGVVSGSSNAAIYNYNNAARPMSSGSQQRCMLPTLQNAHYGEESTQTSSPDQIYRYQPVLRPNAGTYYSPIALSSQGRHSSSGYSQSNLEPVFGSQSVGSHIGDPTLPSPILNGSQDNFPIANNLEKVGGGSGHSVDPHARAYLQSNLPNAQLSSPAPNSYPESLSQILPPRRKLPFTKRGSRPSTSQLDLTPLPRPKLVSRPNSAHPITEKSGPRLLQAKPAQNFDDSSGKLPIAQETLQRPQSPMHSMSAVRLNQSSPICRSKALPLISNQNQPGPLVGEKGAQTFKRAATEIEDSRYNPGADTSMRAKRFKASVPTKLDYAPLESFPSQPPHTALSPDVFSMEGTSTEGRERVEDTPVPTPVSTDARIERVDLSAYTTTSEEERMAQMNNFIRENLMDDGFKLLLEDVGRAWQSIGLGHKLFIFSQISVIAKAPKSANAVESLDSLVAGNRVSVSRPSIRVLPDVSKPLWCSAQLKIFYSSVYRLRHGSAWQMAATSSANSAFNQDDLSLLPNEQNLLLAALSSNQPKASPVNNGVMLTTSNRSAVDGVSSKPNESPLQAAPHPADFSPTDQDESPFLEYDLELDGSYDLDDHDAGPLMIGSLPGTYATAASSLHDKRKNSQDDKGDVEGGGKRREGDEKIPKKPGRKPLTSEPATKKRKAQNRAAQRAFRERKEKHLKDLETKVEDLQRASESANHENGVLRDQVSRLQTEVKEYRRKLGDLTRSSSFGGGFGPYTTRAISQSNNYNDFHFEFPKFGQTAALPVEPTLKDFRGKPGADFAPQIATGRPDKSNISKLESISPNALPADTPTSNSSVNSQSSYTPNGGVSFDSYNPDAIDLYTGLFCPPLLKAGSRNPSLDYMPHNSGGQIESRKSSDAVPQLNGGTNTTNTTSPSASSISQHGPGSSCGTSPEPGTTDSPANMNFVGDNALGTISEGPNVSKGSLTAQAEFCDEINKACLNYANPVPRALIQSNGMPVPLNKTPASEINGIDWFVQQNGGQFDPVLLGNYQESQEAILAGDFDNFFSEAYPISDFGTPMNVADPASSMPKGIDVQPMRQEQSGNEEEVVPGEDTTAMLNCNRLWDHISQNPKFISGDLDIDELCAELRTKAKCSETGAVVNVKDLDDVLLRAASHRKNSALSA
ncbi:MAG: DNA-binding transcription factor yap1 [Trizodia sp. TS-e1964]|nr:MAG: DNA-binding transcription factor yap1 [Trizodia sp. TS-e1964]